MKKIMIGVVVAFFMSVTLPVAGMDKALFDSIMNEFNDSAIYNAVRKDISRKNIGRAISRMRTLTNINIAHETGECPIRFILNCNLYWDNKFRLLEAILKIPGVNPNIVEASGLRALRLAALSGKTECVKMLLESGKININLRAKTGDTVLDNAVWRYFGVSNIAMKNNLIEGIKLLLQHGADKTMHIKAWDGKSPWEMLVNGDSTTKELCNWYRNNFFGKDKKENIKKTKKIDTLSDVVVKCYR